MSSNPEARQISKRRSLLLRFGPVLLVELGWWIWALLDPQERLGRFAQETPFGGKYYYMSITMVFGSMVAGATSEGGGAIAFPVMTLLLSVPPTIARDFSFAIQSFGMTCASLSYFGLQVPMDELGWTTLGGAIGLVVGLLGVAPYLPPAYAKLFFVSTWMTFAVALFRLNATNKRKRTVYMSSKESDEALLQVLQAQGATTHATRLKRHRALALSSTGVFGGICSSISGSGLDMASFSIITLYYRVSEKVATPTSVVLMAGNAIFGLVCRAWWRIGGEFDSVVWNYVSVCVPVVVIGAPLGATLSAKLLSRRALSYLLYILDTLQFGWALAIIRPWNMPLPHSVALCVGSALILILGSVFFITISKWGEKRVKSVDFENGSANDSGSQCSSDSDGAGSDDLEDNPTLSFENVCCSTIVNEGVAQQPSLPAGHGQA